MKKMIILIGLMMSVTTFAYADDIIKMPIQSYSPVEGFDFIYTVKTSKFDNIILDCQSFITGVDFFKDKTLKSHVPLDMFSCEEMITFLDDSKINNIPVCMGLDAENKQLFMSHDEGDDCK